MMHSASLFSHQGRKGQATMSLVFSIGGIVVFIGITLAFLALSFINAGFGYQAANRALMAAQAGVEDGYLQLLRNKDFAPSPYTISVGAYVTNVSISQNSPSTGLVTIRASSTVSGYQRSVQAIVGVVSSTGLMTPISWTQVTL